ncbi:MAG: sugar ABC transporter substrate-binding protein [Rhodospirillales bacterium]|nr:sugar ABC transporter substrate-binding protein [Rhodospirillales bacterium]
MKRKPCAVLSAVFALGVLILGLPQAQAAPAKKLVYFIFTGYAYPYFAPMAAAVKQAATYTPDLEIKIVNANNSASQEIADLKEAVAAGAKGIILNTIQESVTAAAAQAMRQGVPIVTVDRDVSDPAARIAFIGDNDVTLGEELTRYGVQALAARHVPKPWHVVVLQGTLGASVTIGRQKGTMNVLEPLVKDGSVKIVLNQSANFATATAQTMMGALLARTTDIQLVACANDAMALGVINALKSHGITPGEKVLVAGADAQPESLDAVKAGTQIDTVTHSPYVEAFWAVEAMENYLDKGVKPPPSQFPNGDVIIPMTLVTSKNVGTIAAWGTPSEIPPLPYGKSEAHPVGK